MLMTGLLALIAPGTPIQLLVSLFVMVGYFLYLLKVAPYFNTIDDSVSILATAATCVVLLVGLLLIMDEGRAKKSFDDETMGQVLVWITVSTMVVHVCGMIIVMHRALTARQNYNRLKKERLAKKVFGKFKFKKHQIQPVEKDKIGV